MRLIRQIREWLQRRRDVNDMYASLNMLDTRTLHDIGLDRSEILSVAHEAAGLVARQRKLVLTAAGTVLVACTSSMPIPHTLEPAGSTLAMVVPARGVQIYECRAKKSDAGEYEWAFIAPDAELFDTRGHVIGKHGAGPVWQAADGSMVTGKVAARVDAPDARSIPWLLLNTTSSGPMGSFSKVTSIQRVNTMGGIAPAKPCSGEMLGRHVGVHYTADYRFFVQPSANN